MFDLALEEFDFLGSQVEQGVDAVVQVGFGVPESLSRLDRHLKLDCMPNASMRASDDLLAIGTRRIDNPISVHQRRSAVSSPDREGHDHE
jgi:hypothetical protein